MEQIAVHNNTMEIVDYINNNVPGSLHIYDDKLDIYVEQATTFEFTVSKFRNGELHPRIQYLTEDGYLSFRFQDEDHMLIIRKMVEDDYTITVYAESPYLELLNETVGKYKSEVPMTLVEALGIMGFLKNARIDLGLNELSDERRVLEFTGEDTVLTRLKAVVTEFGGEMRLTTNLFPNGEIDNVVLDIYKAWSPTNPELGIGSDRKDIRLFFGRDVEGVKRTIDKTNLFNALRIRDKDGNYYKFKRPYNKENEEGLREIFVERNSSTLYAPFSMRRYPSVLKRNNCDNWTLREKEVEIIKDEETMFQHLAKLLEEFMYPKVTYDVDLINNKVLNKHLIKIGDTLYVNDENFLEFLILRARVIHLTYSISNPSQNKVTLANFTTIKSQLSNDLLGQMRELAKAATPYTMNVKTSNGVFFKDPNSMTTIIPELYQGQERVMSGVTYLYYLNNTYVDSGDSFIVSANSMPNDVAIVTVQALVGNNVVASTEITLSKVQDGESPITMSIRTSSGSVFRNSQGTTTLTAILYRDGEEIDSRGDSGYIYRWYRTDRNGNIDPNFGGTDQQYKESKSIVVTAAQVDKKALYVCEIHKE